MPAQSIPADEGFLLEPCGDESVPLARRRTILIVDEDVAVAEASSEFLATFHDVLPFRLSLKGASETLQRAAPDVVVSEVLFSDRSSGLDYLPRWAEEFPNTRFVVRTAFPDAAPPLDCLRRSAKGYLLNFGRPGLLEELAMAVEIVLKNGIYLCPETASYLRPEAGNPPVGQDLRERRVRCLVAVLGWTRSRAEVALWKFEGLSEAKISNKLRISPSAVHQRVQQLYDRSGIRSEVQLALAVERVLRDNLLSG